MGSKELDKIDVALAIGGIFILANTTPVAVILLLPIGILQYALRRSEWFQQIVANIDRPVLAKPAQFLLPETTEPQTRLEKKALTNTQIYTGETHKLSVDELPFWQRVHMPMDADIFVDNAQSIPVETEISAKTRTQDIVNAIRRLPQYFSYEQLPNPPTRTSVPIGIDSDTKQLMWMDLETNLVHGLIAGMTGTGKDSILRLWYVYLTSYNSPEEIQFVILDGKNEWMLTALECSPYMFVPPAGGVDIIRDEKGRRKLGATERMATSLDRVFEEIDKREQLFKSVGAINMVSYQKKTGKKLPRIVIIATDVGEDFNGDLEVLVRILTMKARSFGINLLISMQTTSKQDTGWRSNLSLIMSGYQALQSADQPIMGISASMIRYRPSQIPDPEQSGSISKGLFTVRNGSKQMLVRTPHLPDEIFIKYLETMLEREEKRNILTEDQRLVQRAMERYGAKLQQTQVITPLDLIEQDYKPKSNTWLLSQDQRIHIIRLTQQRYTKTEIMRDLGYTSGEYYTKYSAEVDKLMHITKKSMRQ